MKATQLLRAALKLSDEGFNALVKDMRDAPLTMSTPGAKGGDGNHPLWSIGHQAFVEASILHLLQGGDHPLRHWAPLFAPGTTPIPDASKYPPFDEVLRAYRDTRARTLAMLEELDDAQLDRKPTSIPAGFEQALATVGSSLMLIALHQMVHYGQVADSRRVAGLKPLR